MDSQQTTTLSRFFELTEDSSLGKMPEIEAGGSAELDKELEKVDGIKWPVVAEQLKDHLPAMLDVSIPGIIARAWCRCGELEKYREKDTGSTGETFLLPVAKHTVQSEHHPYIEIYLNGQQTGKIEFTAKILLELEGLVLKIQDARIKAIHTGKCSGQGVLKYKDVIIAQMKSPDMHLPGSCDLGEGIAILPEA